MIRITLFALAITLGMPMGMSAVTTGGGSAAQAAELKIKIRSTYPYQVYLEFYGQKWNHVWPGAGKVYVLADSKYHTYNLWCRHGDQVCYGAWVTTDESIYWGVGKDDTHGCRGRCSTCTDGTTDPITLGP